MSQAVLKLQEAGILTSLKIKWWKEKRGGGKCAVIKINYLIFHYHIMFNFQTKSEGGDATPLDLKNVGGVFMVLFVGSILGLIGSFLEMAFHVWRDSKARNIPFKDELIKNLKFVLEFRQNIKEVNYENNNLDTEENCLDDLKK